MHLYGCITSPLSGIHGYGKLDFHQVSKPNMTVVSLSQLQASHIEQICTLTCNVSSGNSVANGIKKQSLMRVRRLYLLRYIFYLHTYFYIYVYSPVVGNSATNKYNFICHFSACTKFIIHGTIVKGNLFVIKLSWGWGP